MRNLKRYFIICQCHSPEHQVILQYYEDERPEWQELYIDIHLADYQNIFQRWWAAMKYIFGYKSKYGEFDDILVSPDEAKNIIKFMQEFVDASEVAKETEEDKEEVIFVP